jgi:UPF0755 protein
VKKLVRPLAVLLVLIVCAGVGGYVYLKQQFRIPHSNGTGPVIIEISKGSGSRDVVRLLRERNLIRSEYVALGYLALTGSRGKLRAGEYMFDTPMTVGEVLEKIASGKIYLHKFTVPEGLTMWDTARRWEDQGFGSAEGFLIAAKHSVGLIHDLDKDADSLEGYLFPETYSFPSRTPPEQAIAAMVARFHEVIEKLHQQIPADQWPPNLHQTIILASIVESEAAHDDERATIASVYQNRLRKKMLLQCDTTVIYALELEHRYRGTLTFKDLKFNSGYNTYVYPGLPPGAIMNPGYESLAAAFRPATTNYIYFVRTSGGHHTFSETLAAHNKAVAQYHAMIHSQSK